MRTALNRSRTLALLLALAALAAPALAAPPPADIEGTVVQEFVVTAKAPGPAWWRVSSPTATVWILGEPGALPSGLKWNTSLAERRLKGANVLITPPVVTAGLGDLFALLRARAHFRAHGPMEADLAPDLRARFLADRRLLTNDTRAYSGWTPLVAGLLMVQDQRRKARLDREEPTRTVSRLARRAGVRVTPAATYKAVPFVRAIEGEAAAAGPPCLADALDEVEAGPGRAGAAAQGWARGDVSAALSEQRGYEKCLASLAGANDLVGREIADTTAAIDAALRQSGHAVALVNLRALLAEGGVLQRLRARGYAIALPE